MWYHANNNRADVIEASSSTSRSTFRHLDNLLNIDNIYFKRISCRIYLAKIQLKEANSMDNNVSLWMIEEITRVFMRLREIEMKCDTCFINLEWYKQDNFPLILNILYEGIRSYLFILQDTAT